MLICTAWVCDDWHPLVSLLTGRLDKYLCYTQKIKENIWFTSQYSLAVTVYLSVSLNCCCPRQMYPGRSTLIISAVLYIHEDLTIRPSIKILPSVAKQRNSGTEIRDLCRPLMTLMTINVDFGLLEPGLHQGWLCFGALSCLKTKQQPRHRFTGDCLRFCSQIFTYPFILISSTLKRFPVPDTT